MKTVVLLSSPKRSGNTEFLLENFLKECKEQTEVINVYNLKVNPCTDCKGCINTGRCVINDDMNKIYETIDNCNKIIIASPVYFTSFPAPLKVVIDRFQPYWSRKFVIKEKALEYKKKAALLLTCGAKEENSFIHCEAVMKQFFSLINAEFISKIYVDGTDNYPIDKNHQIIKYAVEKGREFCRAV